MDRTPESLLQKLRLPEAQQAWTRFVELYTPLLYCWCRRLGLQVPEAADLVQDVFVVLLQKLPDFTYDHRKSFRAWLRTVTVNKWREKQRRRSELPFASLPADPVEPAGHADADLLDEKEYRQYVVRRALELIQADFQPTTWKACWEVVVAGRSAADVAAELGASVDVVYAAKSRVLRRLREELAGLLD